MAALLNMQNNIMYIDSLNQRYKVLYPKLSSLSDDERREVENIKKETLTALGQILSMNCEEYLKKSFYDKLNLLNQGINSVLNEKTAELNKFVLESENANYIIEDIAKDVCKLDMLDTNITIRYDIEKILFYLKNKVTNIGVIDKKLYALEYLRDKLDNYKKGLYSLIMLAKKHGSKKELSFDEKKEIFNIFSSVSFEYHYDNNHSKVFNEDLNDISLDLNTTDYIKWLENIFVELLDVVGVKLEKCTDDILALVNETNATKINIENYITFIGKKYDSDIVNYYDSLVEKKIESVRDIKNVLHNCFVYDQNKDYNYILDKINKNHRLPEILVQNEYRKYIEGLLFEYNFKEETKADFDEIIEEVASLMFEKFEPERYINIYEYNIKQKNKQISLFKDYLNELLLKSKDILREKYLNQLENKLEENMLEEFNTAKTNEDTKKRKRDIDVLKKALVNIKERYKEYDEYANMKYISSIERTYNVQGLSTEISVRRKSLFANLKNKNINKKDAEYFEEFLKGEDLNKELIKTISYDVLVGNDSIRFEVLGKILI